MEYHRLLKHTITAGNVVSLLICIVTFCLALGRWYIIVGGVFTLIVAIVGLLFAFAFDTVRLLAFAIGATLDFIFLLTNCIVLLLFLANLKRLCVDLDNSYLSILPDDEGCSNYYETSFYYGNYRARILALVTLLCINAVIRVITLLATVLLLKYITDGGKTHDEEEDT